MSEIPMGCYSREELQAFLSSTGEGDLAQEISRHLESCQRCRDSLERIANENMEMDTLRDALRQPPIASNRLSAVMEDLSATVIGAPPVVGAGLTFADVQPWIQETAPGSIGRFADFDLIECVGRGGMGIVFRAFDASLDRPVAVKLMLPALAGDLDAKQRFFREARSIAAVRHPNVVAVHAVSEQDGLPFLVAEFVEGHSLQDSVDCQRPLDAEDVRRIGADIAAGLDACHQVGVLHRDIKLANILIDGRSGAAKITDFGLATLTSSPALTRPGHLAGTPGYLAPERLAGAPSDERSDLFSLGCVLYALAAGVEPFKSESPLVTMHQIAEHEPAPLRKLNPNIPESLERTIATLMSKRPQDRPASAEVVRSMLLSGANPPPAIRRGNKRFPIRAVIGACVGLALVVAVAAWSMSRPDHVAAPPDAGQKIRVKNVTDLEQAIESAADDCVIEIQTEEFLVTDGIEIVNKSITIQAANDIMATIALTEDEDHEDALLRIEHGTLTLIGVTIEDHEIETDDYKMVALESATLVATGCRFESNSHGVGVGIDIESDAEFSNCEFFSMNGVGIEWDAGEGQTLRIERSLNAGVTALLLNAAEDADLYWVDSLIVATEFAVEFMPEEGQVTAYIDTCRIQSEEAIIVLEHPSMSIQEFQEHLKWHGTANKIYGQPIDFTEADDVPKWTMSFSSWVDADEGSLYGKPLFRNELEWVIEQLLDGEPIEELLY